jgi:hypothetical protein
MTPPIACNLSAIPDRDRPLYQRLSGQLRAAIAEFHELADGCTLALSQDAFSLVDAAQWIRLERLCCPFLTFQLEAGAAFDFRLTMRGPAGVKAIVRDEFIARRTC